MEAVLIVLAAVVLVVIAWALVKKQHARRVEGKREEAGELRQTARRHQLEAERKQMDAQQARAKAAEHQHLAEEVDPDVDGDGQPDSGGRSFNTGNGRVTERGPVDGRSPARR